MVWFAMVRGTLLAALSDYGIIYDVAGAIDGDRRGADTRHARRHRPFGAAGRRRPRPQKAAQPLPPSGSRDHRAAGVQRLAWAAEGGNARLAGDLQGAARTSVPLTSGRASPGAPAVRGSWQIERRAAIDPGKASLHDLGLLRLAQGRLNEAILTLESVGAVSGAEAGPANDLAVAYLTRAEAQDRAFDLVLSIAAAERALMANPRFPQALGAGARISRTGRRRPGRAHAFR